MSAARTTPAVHAEAQADVAAPASTKVSKTKSIPASRKPSANVGKPAKKPQAPAPAADKDAKTKKPKLVRDSFTIPKDEYAAIEGLKQRTAKLSRPTKKSELLRAGFKLLAGLDDAALLKAMQAVPAIKTGRPKADKK